MIVTIARLLVVRRTTLLGLSLIATLLLGLGITQSGFDTSLSALMTRSDPYLQERDRMLAEFPESREISFALVPENGPEHNDVFSRPVLQALADLQREFRQIPLARSMSSIIGWQSPTGEVSLIDRPYQLDSYSREELDAARQRGLNDPFVVGRLLSPQADLAIAVVGLETDILDREQSRAVADAVLALRDSLQARHPQVAIHASSESLFEQSSRDAMLSDLTVLLPLVLLLCSAIVCYSFRSIALGLCVLGTALLTVLMTVGTFGWLGKCFNTVSVMAPLVVVTIATAASVHVISIFRQHIAAGEEKRDAMLHSLHFNIRPVSLASITTAIGFASLNLASSPAVSTFGSVVAVGVLHAFLLTLCALPGVVLLLPSRPAKHKARGLTRSSLIDKIIQGCRLLVSRHGQLLLWSTSITGITALGFSFLNQADFDRMSFISEDSPLHDYYLAVSERMERGPMLVYGIDTQQGYAVIEPQFLQRLDAFADWLRTQDEILNVASLAEVIKTINQVMNEDREEAYRIPEEAQRIEQHLMDYRQVERRDFTLNNFASTDFSLVRLFITTRPMSNQGIIELDERINAGFADHFPEATLLHGSSTLLFARMDRAVTVELLRGYGFSVLMISIALIIGLRSVYYGLLSTLPNMLPATLVFGFWGLVVGQIDPFVMMLFSISIGLVVDDTVHILSAYQEGRQRGHAPPQAASRAMQRAGPALIITTTVMAVGTSVLIGASTLYFQQAATLLVPIVVLALVLDLTFFPALLLRLDRDGETKRVKRR